MSDNEKKKKKKKWTLMFFFASDNSLSPSMLYQLKSIKTAGYQLDTNVLVHFDPHERGIPSMIFEINRMEKRGQTESKIGDDRDPIVRDLAGDQVEPKIDENGFRNSPADYDRVSAEEALTHFLDFSREHYPADRYMLFLVGHGMVVGHDAFLPDENPNTGISLVNLGTILGTFSDEIRKHGGELDLIGMHSCSMSAVEVAYQLKGTAKYMMASEGLSFVGAWPYRQMLQKIFCAIENAKEAKREILIHDLMKRLHELCIHNSADFIFAGYSSDLCLCSLEPTRVEALTAPVETLAKALQAGLKDDRGKELILLAHWKSQSYYQEIYTDLFDFCLCLRESCSESDTNQVQKAMKLACDSVIKVLTPESNQNGGGPIVQADFFGPDCQYSYGLSIYFPWTRPVEDATQHVIKNYQSYAFVTKLYRASWLEFLNAYFQKTLRPKREIELNAQEKKAMRFAELHYNPAAFQGTREYASQALEGKVSPADASGYFTYSFIKNYSRELSITGRALKVFQNERRGKAKKKKQK